MVKTRHFFLFFAYFLSIISLSGQITLKEIPHYNLTDADSLFLDINNSRSLTSLEDNWKVYSPDSPEKKVDVTIPSTFTGEESLVYERQLFFTSEQLKTKNFTLHFLGINYTADVLFNDMVIYKHPGGTQPFGILLPNDIISPDNQNKLTVRIYYKLDDVNTIPVTQRFLFPDLRGGVIGDVYLIETNNLFISKIGTETNISIESNSAKLLVNTTIQNNQEKLKKAEHANAKKYSLKYKLKSSSTEQTFDKIISEIKQNEPVEIKSELNIPSPIIWSPESPTSYTLEVELSVNDSVVDISSRSVALYSASIQNNKLFINGKDFVINGTTYFPSEEETGGLISLKKLHEDIKLIKDTGFNTIRFAKILPPAYALHLCESIGLFALVELPLNSIPDQILTDSDFSDRVTNHINLMLDQYSSYSAILGFGLGGGYLGTSADQYEFIRSKAEFVKNKTHRIVYASFISLPGSKINSLDLAGIELCSATESRLTEFKTNIDALSFPIFISEATYPSFNGNSNGYLNKNSYEAAAKYFVDVMDFAKNENLNGFVLNSFYDYAGDYKSFYTGYNENFIYSIGLLPNAKTIDRISYNVVKSKLSNGEKITIPIGTPKDDSPILFVIIGLLLSIFMALLINSKRKFREDAGRALIRPYNFFADIRDHRLLSGFQTNLLMFILAGSFSLLFINLLHFLRTNLLLEKILLSFGSPSVIDWVIYLAWHPLNGFVILFFVAIVCFFILSMVIKLFSFSLKTKVYFSSIYYSVIWAFLPLSLILPLELVLYRVLSAEIVNLYIYIFIILYLLWLGQRLLKGVHVIFDIRATKVHIYGIVIIVIILGGILLYFQLANSTIYHLLRVVPEYKFL